MTLELRRSLLFTQMTHEEGGKSVDKPTLLVAAMGIIKNPWYGRGWVEDLSPEVRSIGPELGKLLTKMVLDVTGMPLKVMAKPQL